MNLDYDKIMERANSMYREVAIRISAGNTEDDTAPTSLPQIQNEQIKAVTRAIVEEINKWK